MIAGRGVLLVSGYALAPEARAEIEAAGVLIIDLGQRDPVLVVRHIRHALLDPMPLLYRNSLLAPQLGTPRRDLGKCGGRR